ncbi:TolC family protein [Xanthocytophaga agilis]|uniref:TolC family protein n=1 Tax=Xanthocytophaga agilis TaxID=3048010 RepID=A0AAE3UK35_9BACT|nr:TolC family protein [Xanthocytophaga agilis]MDJ1506208.1 TolC family protein [Xanthocytophaga agilis]
MRLKNQNCLLPILLLLCMPLVTTAQQTKPLSLEEALTLGVSNSKSLKLSKAKIEEVTAQQKITKEQRLPQAKASIMYNHAFMLTNQFQLSPGAEPFVLPRNADVYLGTASVNQVIYSGNKHKYADESAALLTKIAELDVTRQENEIKLAVIQLYFNLYKIKQSQKVIQQNFQDIDEKIIETEKFVKQGLATENDVLRWKLQRSNIEISNLDLTTSQKTVSYHLGLLLGLTDDNLIEVDTSLNLLATSSSFQDYVNQSLSNRKEVTIADYQNQHSRLNIKSIQSSKYPTLAAGAALYHINPNANPIPKANSTITPLTVGLTLSYDIASLYTTKAKISQAEASEKQTTIAKTVTEDNIRTEVKQSYEGYVQAREKIKLLEVATEQATENYRITNSKYKNNVASTTDRIDAETLLFQAKINLELAKADAVVAYYTLLKSAGMLP